MDEIPSLKTLLLGDGYSDFRVLDRQVTPIAEKMHATLSDEIVIASQTIGEKGARWRYKVHAPNLAVSALNDNPRLNLKQISALHAARPAPEASDQFGKTIGARRTQTP